MTLLVLAFVILLIIGMPVAFVVGLAGVAFFASTADLPFSIVVQRIVAQTQSYSFLAVPFFIFAGTLMNESGITQRILQFASALTRRMWGGVAQVSVIMSTMMGGISGSATADAAMETRLLGPEMQKRGYNKGYIVAVNSLTSMITATIPPSLGLIIYGFVGEVSIGRLFAAGIIPGVLMMIFLMATVTITCKRNQFDIPNKELPRITLSEFLVNLRNSIWALIFPVILIVGIRFGFFTPSEAGAFCIVYAILIGALVYRELTWKKFWNAMKTAVIDTAAVMLLITMSGPFSYAVTYCRAAGARQPDLRHHQPAPAPDDYYPDVAVYSGHVPRQQRQLPAADPDLPAHGAEGGLRPGAFRHPDGDHRYNGGFHASGRFGHLPGLRNPRLPCGRIHQIRDAVFYRDLSGNAPAGVCPQSGHVPAEPVLWRRRVSQPAMLTGSERKRYQSYDQHFMLWRL